MNKFFLMSVGAAMAAASAASAANIALTATYVGSSTTTIAAPAIGIPGSTPPAGLSVLDFTNAASQTSSWIHAIRLDMSFTSSPGLSEDFSALTFDVTTSPGVSKSNRAGNLLTTAWTSNTSAHFYGNNAGMQISDAGFDGNFVAAIQADGGVGYTNQLGESAPYTLGWAFVKVPDWAAVPEGGSINFAGANGQNLSFFTNNDDLGSGTKMTEARSGIAASFVIKGGDIPEPASLGLAAIAGLGLIRRRRA